MKPVCLVFGAGAGIGGTVASKFASEGYHSYLCRRSDQEGLDKLIGMVDVRLRQTNLPEQNFDATLQRMIAEREREATDERARGREAAQRVTAVADRTHEETLSAAKRDALIIEGEADAERTRILANAFGADPEFFDFYRSLAAYEASILGGNSTLVIPSDHEFLTYMKSATPRVAE